MAVGECQRKPPAPAGESELESVPFADGAEALLVRLTAPLGKAGAAVFDAVAAVFGWIIVPFAFLVGLTTFISAGMSRPLEAGYAVAVAPARLLGHPDPVLLASVLLLVAVRLVVLPFSLRAARKAGLMQALQPRVRALQERHRGDRDELRAALMELYRNSKASPLAGCLPMLIVIPAFLAFWGLIKGLTVRSPAGTFAPEFVHPGTAIHEHLSTANGMTAWRMNLLITMPDVGWCAAFTPYAVLFALAGVLAYVQTLPMLAAMRSKRAVLAFAAFQVGSLVLLPTFFVVLKVVDSALSIGQAELAKRRRIRAVDQLRRDPEFQRAIGEEAGGQLLDHYRRQAKGSRGPGDVPDWRGPDV